MSFFTDSEIFHLQKLTDKLFLLSTTPLEEDILSGYMFLNNNFYNGTPPMCEFNTAVNGIGNYVFWKKTKEGYSVCHDFFGLGNIFTFKNESIHIISNRQHLISIICYILNIQYTINNNYIKTFILDWFVFRDQSINDDTCITQINRLPIDCIVHISDQGISIEKRHINKPILAEKKYNFFLEKGIHDICQNSHILENFAYQNSKILITDLTGGKDSRMTLAPFLLKKEKLLIRTTDVQNSQDLNISLKISSIYKLKYEDDFFEYLYKISPSTALSIWRSYFMGVYNRMAIPTLSTLGEAHNSIQISGGCGELYRDYWGFLIPLAKNTFRELLKYFLTKNVYIKKYSEKTQKELEEYVLSSLKDLLDMPAKEALQLYYERVRVRTHFGLRLFSNFHDIPCYFTLLSKNLYWASKCIPLNDFNDARIAYDTISKIDKQLADIEYDHGYPYAEKKSSSNIFISKNDILAKKVEYTNSKNKRNKARHSKLINLDHSKSIDLNRFIQIKVAESTCRILTLYPDLENFFEIFINMYISKITKDLSGANILASRIFSLEDSLLPLESTKQSVSINSLDNWIQPIQSIHITATKNMTCTINLYDDRYMDMYDYAFYLHISDKIMEKKWYHNSLSTTFTFKITDHKEIAVTGFARHKKTKKVFQLTQKYKEILGDNYSPSH